MVHEQKITRICLFYSSCMHVVNIQMDSDYPENPLAVLNTVITSHTQELSNRQKNIVFLTTTKQRNLFLVISTKDCGAI